MSHIAKHRIRRCSIQGETEVRTALTILSTYQDVEVVLLLQVKLITQGICCTPSPTCSNLVCCLILCSEIIRIGSVGIEYREECTPCPSILIVIQLSTVNQILDWLDLQITCSMQILVDTLVVTRLLVQHLIDWVYRIRVVIIYPVLQVLSLGIAAVCIIHRDSRIGTKHIGKLIAILVTNLDTLILLVLIVNILTNLHYIHTLVVAIDDML